MGWTPIRARFNRLSPATRASEKALAPRPVTIAQIDSQEQQSNQQISFPVIAQGDSEREPGEETDDVSDIGDLRVVAGDPAFFIDHYDVVDEVNDRDQSLRREEKPGKLERAHEHDASCESEDGRRSSQHSRATRHKDHSDDEAHEAARKENCQEFTRTYGVFQGISEDEEKQHVAEKM